MIAIEILNEIKTQIERSKDYGMNVDISYNKAYYLRICKALFELEYLAYENCTVREVLNNRKISYTTLDDNEINSN